MAPRRNDLEFKLQCAVVEHLRTRANPNVYFTAIPLGELRTKGTAGRIKAMGAVAGAPDLLIIVGGVPYGLELKADASGRQNDAQRLTEQRWNRAGGIYKVAHGIDEALDCLMAWGALKAQPERSMVPNLPFGGEWST